MMPPVVAPFGELSGRHRSFPLDSIRSLLLFLILAGGLSAHEVGLSTVRLLWRADVIELQAAYAPADVAKLLPPSARPAGGIRTAADLAAVKVRLEELAPLLVELSDERGPLALYDLRIELESGDNLSFRYTYAAPAGGLVRFRSLDQGAMSSTHRQLFTSVAEDGTVLVEKLLAAGDAPVEVVRPAPVAPAGARPAATPTMEFLKLGVEHIWTGYDHLLFLFGLLVVCRTFKSIVGIITCFTVGHSLTLVLATLDLVSLSARFVEPVIAASIVFVGAENLLRRGEEPPGRWVLTFLFGLIHGFGFASVLRDLGVGVDGPVVLPLFAFNLGVEFGQVALAALVLPLVWWMRKSERFLRRGVPALSSLVVLAGLYWLVERTLLA